jgi:autotransporter adhesin
VRRDANGGTSMALAAAALPQPYEAGKGMLALAGGTYRGEASFAVGASKAFVDGHTVLKMGATYGTHASVGASAGLGYQF